MLLPNSPSYVWIQRPGQTDDGYLSSSAEILSGPQNPTVTIRYRVFNPDGSRVIAGSNATGTALAKTYFEFSVDGGSTWRRATRAAESPSRHHADHPPGRGWHLPVERRCRPGYRRRRPLPRARGGRGPRRPRAARLHFGRQPALPHPGHHAAPGPRTRASTTIRSTRRPARRSTSSARSTRAAEPSPSCGTLATAATSASGRPSSIPSPETATQAVTLTVTGEACPINRERSVSTLVSVGIGTPEYRLYLPMIFQNAVFIGHGAAADRRPRRRPASALRTGRCPATAEARGTRRLRVPPAPPAWDGSYLPGLAGTATPLHSPICRRRPDAAWIPLLADPGERPARWGSATSRPATPRACASPSGPPPTSRAATGTAALRSSWPTAMPPGR